VCSSGNKALQGVLICSVGFKFHIFLIMFLFDLHMHCVRCLLTLHFVWFVMTHW
jgi:hypothetical protein